MSGNQFLEKMQENQKIKKFFFWKNSLKLDRFMIGWIMVTLMTQWLVIFFEAKEVCAELINKGDLTDTGSTLFNLFFKKILSKKMEFEKMNFELTL